MLHMDITTAHTYHIAHSSYQIVHLYYMVHPYHSATISYSVSPISHSAPPYCIANSPCYTAHPYYIEILVE